MPLISGGIGGIHRTDGQLVSGEKQLTGVSLDIFANYTTLLVNLRRNFTGE